MKEAILRYKWPLIVVAATLLVRWVYLLELSFLPGFTVPMVDELWHWRWAGGIIEQSFWGESAWFRAPLYLYFLALLKFITGGSIFWSKFLQVLLAGGTVFLLYRLAYGLFGRTTAIVAGLTYALYAPLVFYETMYLFPVLFLFFLVWGIERIVTYRDSFSSVAWLTTGLIFGLAAITRPNILLVMPVFALWLWLPQIRKMGRLAALKRPAVMAAGVILVILPITVRNLVVTGEFILISSQGGINFYLANNEVSDGLTMIMPEVDLDESVSWSEFIPITTAAAEKEAGRELSVSEVSAFWTDKAVSFITGQPGKFLGLTARKTAYLFNGYENSDNVDIYHQRTKSGLFSVLLWRAGLYFPFGFLLPLTIMGIILHRRRFSDLVPIYLFVLAYIPTIVLFLVTSRHRLPLIPFMIILAAAGTVSVVEQARRKQWRVLAIPIAVSLILLWPVNLRYLETIFAGSFQVHFNQGMKFDRLENYAESEKEYLLADEQFPYSASLINNLGHAQLRLGKLDEADRNFHRAIALEPQQATWYNNLGLVVRRKGLADSSFALFRRAVSLIDSSKLSLKEMGQMYGNLGDGHEAYGQIDSATANFETSMEVSQGQGRTYYKAAAYYARIGRHEEADSLFWAAKKYDNAEANDLFNWGLSQIESRKFSEGSAKMIGALILDPTMHQAYYCVAVVYFENNMPMDSVNYYLDQCLNHAPQYSPGLNLRRLIDQSSK